MVQDDALNGLLAYCRKLDHLDSLTILKLPIELQYFAMKALDIYEERASQAESSGQLTNFTATLAGLLCFWRNNSI